MLTICTWLWGDKYEPSDVEKLMAGVHRHLHSNYRFMVVTSDFRGFSTTLCSYLIDPQLTKVPGCFARLRMFDPEWQRANEIDDRLVCLDLDTVITGPLDPLFDRPEPFVILGGANAVNPCPFNGSVMMLRPGAHQEVWSDFSLEAASKIKFHEFPDDQGWIWHKVPGAATWKVGTESGIYAFMKPGWPQKPVFDAAGEDHVAETLALPKDARMVVFPGWRSPEKFKHLPWVKEHWQ